VVIFPQPFSFILTEQKFDERCIEKEKNLCVFLFSRKGVFKTKVNLSKKEGK